MTSIWPTIARKQTLVQLTDDLVRRLDQEAERTGSSRSALIRRAIELYLQPRWDEEVARQYREAYAHQPQTEEEAEWVDIATEALVERLDDKEGW